MLTNKKAHILEEFTRFGGGQTVFEYVYSVLTETFNLVKVITDRDHRYLPSYITKSDIIETKFSNPDWDSPVKLLPRIYSLKKELEDLPHDGFTFNNHPNVFIYNSTINFGHEIFGFMSHNPRATDKLKLLAIKKTGIFNTYNDAFFLTNGRYSKRLLEETFSSLGIANLNIEQIDLPTYLPDNLTLDDKERNVLTFGRISRDKSLDIILEIASSLPEIKFTISGRAVERDAEYVRHLKEYSPRNLAIVINPDIATKDSLFRKSKVYLHTKKNENYGISVAEAVSYGCFPVVPREGGPYEDILMGGKIGRGYSDKTEIPCMIEEGFGSSKEDLQNILSTRDRFSHARFRSKLLDIMERRI